MNLLYQTLADAVLLLHTSFVVFVVAALALIIVGGYRQWRWVRNGWFRIVHLGGIAIVVAQSWAGLLCPLTTLEMWLRGQAGGVQYEGSFIQYWLERVLYYEAPGWVFVVAYTVFGLLVILTWLRFPPKKISGS
ncbi:DUF2784 domain-containing protein [Amphritea sp. HPY]|uniref:DUF2784 domain-containing protein n=1 Tax=Amphritea sp. HPY TaxID=3421652 RepID=UPI003D7D67AE